MNIKKYKPTTPGRRGMTSLDYSDLSKVAPERSLLKKIKKHSGRNNTGKITVRHKGGGYKKIYRIIDFKRDKDGIKGKVATIEYDPNRNCHISLINYIDGEKRYILTPNDLKIGDEIISDKIVPIKTGSACLIKNIPPGTFIHNIEIVPGKGGQIARSAGSSAQILGFDESEKYAILRLTSRETRKILINCKATIGEAGNKYYNLVKIGKAGRNRYRGIRPTVRGSAMNPNDHPHGGGEGRTGIGRKAPLTPWGKKALGVKTRKLHHRTDKLIVRRRKK